MPMDNAAVLRQIDDVLARFKEVAVKAKFDDHSKRHLGVTNTEATEVITLIQHTIERFRPPGRVTFGDEALTKNIGPDQVLQMKVLGGMLAALRAEYKSDRLQSFRELVHADLFADFLEMADYLLEQGYKDAAAVTAGAVLEEHLRKLCGLHSVPVTLMDKRSKVHPKMLDSMNTDLAKAGVYDKIEKQLVTAWAAIRNAAAHGEYPKYVAEQVGELIAGLRGFITRHPT